MVAVTAICADSDEEARYLASSLEQSFVALRTGEPGRLKPPVAGYRESLSGGAQAMLAHLDSVRAIGSPATVRAAIRALQDRTGADEIIVAGATYDPDAGIRSLELTMAAMA